MNKTDSLRHFSSLRRRARGLLQDVLSDFMPQKLQPVIVNYARLQQLEALEPESYLALAYVALELDQPAQALSLLATLLRLDPGHAEARALYLHLREGRPLT